MIKIASIGKRNMKYNKRYSRIFVAPEFEKKIKERALNDGLSLVDFTRKVSRDDFDEFICNIKPKKISRGGSLNGFI